jgi:hypothetical protein
VVPQLHQMSTATNSIAISDDALEEPEVVMGHLDLGALGQVYVLEVVDTALFALQQAWDVFLREQKDLDDERARLLTWGSMLKKWTTSEKQKAVARQQWLDKKGSLLAKEEVAIGELDTKACKLMESAKELYAQVEGHVNTTIK